MWLLYAVGSALFAGLTAILAKLGISKTDSTVATAIRTVVVVLFAWLIVFLTGAQSGLAHLSGRTLVYLVLSGLATGASWLCYFRALQTGPVSQVAAIDKTSTVITILLAFVLLHESASLTSIFGVILIALGTFLMLDPNPFSQKASRALTGRKIPKDGSKEARAEGKKKATGTAWFWFAAGAALFASLSAIFGKVGIDNVDSNLGTAIRTVVILLMSWMMVLVSKKQSSIKAISAKEMSFILASGLATGASWLFYYHALHTGPASTVVPVDKLSILVTVLFSVLVLHEKLSKKAWIGLGVLCLGTLLMVVSG